MDSQVDSHDQVDSHGHLPTAWNIYDKLDFLSVNSDGLRVNYTGKVIRI